jgi:hypothetical protein
MFWHVSQLQVLSIVTVNVSQTDRLVGSTGSGILKNTFWKLNLFPSSGDRVGDTDSFVSVRKS